MTPELFSKELHNSIPANRDTFGKFIGTWSLQLTISDPSGSSLKYSGEWHFFRILQGRAIQDIWIIPSLMPKDNDEYHEYGTTIRTYNPKTEKWKAVWVGPIQNQLFMFDVEDNDEEIILTETKSPNLEMKWTFYNISENAFQWKSEVKVKGSDSWFTNYHMKLTRI